MKMFKVIKLKAIQPKGVKTIDNSKNLIGPIYIIKS